MNNEDIICHCMQVTRGEIIEAIQSQGFTTVEEVQEATQAGTGCGGCIEEIESILAEING